MRQRPSPTIIAVSSAAILLLVLSVSTGCSAASPLATEKGVADTGAAPVKGGRVIFGSASDAKNLTPFLVTDSPSRAVSNLIFEGLVTTDPKTGAPIPKLAESWEVSQDGKKYTFKIREGVKWHDGVSLTAEDAKFTYEIILDPKTKTVRKSLYDQVKRFSAPDARTLVVELNESFCPFLVSGMGMGIVPKHILEKSADINTDDFNIRRPVGTGPFIFKEWARDDHITLAANEEYWNGRPNIDTFIYKIVKDVNVIIAQLKTGELDVGEFTAQPQLLSEMEATSGLKVYKYSDLSYTYLAYNMARPAFQDKRVRQALSMALDREKLLKTLLNGQGELIHSHIPPISWAYAPDVPKFPYDPQKAKGLLRDAGYTTGPDGFLRDRDGKSIKLTLYTSTANKVREGVATVAKEQFKEIGVDVDIQLEQFSALVDRVNKSRDFDMVIIGWSLGTDPDSKSIWHSTEREKEGGLNFVNYVNPEVDRLIDQGRTLPGCDQGARKEIYNKFQKALADDQPYNFLFTPRVLYGASQRLQNIDPSPWSGILWNIEDWFSSTGK